MTTFDEIRRSVDERAVASIVQGFKNGRGSHEDDVSDEAFVAMLLAVREEIVSDDFWWFRDQARSGAEGEIHYAMKVDEFLLARRQAIVRDFVDTIQCTNKQRRAIEGLLMGWLP